MKHATPDAGTPALLTTLPLTFARLLEWFADAEVRGWLSAVRPDQLAEALRSLDLVRAEYVVAQTSGDSRTHAMAGIVSDRLTPALEAMHLSTLRPRSEVGGGLAAAVLMLLAMDHVEGYVASDGWGRILRGEVTRGG